jgi:hypothetical protein
MRPLLYVRLTPNSIVGKAFAVSTWLQTWLLPFGVQVRLPFGFKPRQRPETE